HCCRDVALWDFATFRSFLIREAWKAGLARPGGGRGMLLRAGLAAFERTYVESFPDLYPERVVPPLLLRLLELQRIGQLMVRRVAKVRLAGRGRAALPLGAYRRFHLLLSSLAHLPLLEAQKRGTLLRIADQAGPP